MIDRRAEKRERIAAVYDREKGASAGMLGEALGVTRNVVIGWYTRDPELKRLYPLGGNKRVPTKSKYFGSPRLVGPAKPAKVRSTPAPVDAIARQNRIDALRAQADAPPEPNEEGEYLLEALPANGCKWPSGENPTFFCGADRGDHASYCPAHAKRSIDPRRHGYRR